MEANIAVLLMLGGIDDRHFGGIEVTLGTVLVVVEFMVSGQVADTVVAY